MPSLSFIVVSGCMLIIVQQLQTDTHVVYDIITSGGDLPGNLWQRLLLLFDRVRCTVVHSRIIIIIIPMVLSVFIGFLSIACKICSKIVCIILI